MRQTRACVHILGILAILALGGCIPPPYGPGGPPPPTSSQPTPGFDRVASILAGVETRLAGVQGVQATQGGDIQNALAWAKASHEAASRPIPSVVGSIVGTVAGQPVGALAAEVGGFLTVLVGFFFRRRSRS